MLKPTPTPVRAIDAPRTIALAPVCSGSFLKLYIIHRCPFTSKPDRYFRFFQIKNRFALCSSHLRPFRYSSSDLTRSARVFRTSDSWRL